MRPKEFSRNAVLEKSINLFWREGFNGTGIQKLVSSTCVNRYSLYDEFGSKDGILYASLDLYKARHVPFELLTKPASLDQALFEFYLSFFVESGHNKHPAGCYISNMAMELRESEEMKGYFNKYLNELEQKFSELIDQKTASEHEDKANILKQLILYYCTCMGMYVIFPQSETEKYLRDQLNLITKCLNN